MGLKVRLRRAGVRALVIIALIGTVEPLVQVAATGTASAQTCSGTSFSDDFATDGSLDAGCWETSSTVIARVASDLGASNDVLAPSFSDGMSFSSSAADNSFAAIQSTSAYQAPFTFTASVSANSGAGDVAAIYLVNEATNEGFSFEEVADPADQCGTSCRPTTDEDAYGMWANEGVVGTNQGPALGVSPAYGTTYTISMSVDDNDTGWVSVNGGPQTDIGTVSDNGPFYVLLAQREGVPVDTASSASNSAVWSYANLGPTCGSGYSFSEVFADENALNPSCWATSTPLLSEVAGEIGDNAELETADTSVAPNLSFSDGMSMELPASANPEFAGIQSTQAYSAPFTLQATVGGEPSGASPFSVYLASEQGASSVAAFGVDGVVGSTQDITTPGIWGDTTVPATLSDVPLVSNATTPTVYNISVSVNATDQVSFTINGVSGGPPQSIDGPGPYYVVLGESNINNNPATVPDDEAVWYSAAVADCGTPTSFSEDFATDSALSGCWLNPADSNFGTNPSISPVVQQLAETSESAVGAPGLSFAQGPGGNGDGYLLMSGADSDNDETGIESTFAYSAPFTLETQVSALVSNVDPIDIYLVPIDPEHVLNVEGDVTPEADQPEGSESQQGIFASNAVEADLAGEPLVLDPQIGKTYDITMSVDAAGNASASVDGGTPVQFTGIFGYDLGLTPFYVVLGQRAGGTDVAGDNETAWYSTSLTPSGGSLTATLSTGSPTVNSVESVPASSIPATSVDSSSGTSTANAASIPLSSIPLSSIGLAASPLSSIPLSSIPLSSITLPTGANTAVSAAQQALSSTLLSDLSIDFPAGCGASPAPACTGWAGVLAGSEYAGLPLEAVTLAEVLADTTAGTVNNEPVPSPAANFETVDLGDLNLASSPLSSIPLSSIALGATTLSSIPINGSTSGTSAISAWCSVLGATECSDLGITPTSDNGVTLLTLALAGVPLSSIPLSSIPLSSIPLSSIPLSSIPLSSINLASNPLSSIPLSSIPLSSIPLSSIPLSSIPLSSIPLSSIPLSSIPLSSIQLVVDCATFVSCTTGTLGEAATQGAILPGATLGDLASYGSTTLGDLPASAIEATTPQTTVGQLLIGDNTTAPGYPDLTLADLLLSTVPPSSYPWPTVDLATLPLAANATSSAGEIVTYFADFNVSGAASTAEVTLDLPAGFSYVPGSTSLDENAEPDPAGTTDLSWTFVLTPGPHTLAVEASAGTGLGPATATLSTVMGGTTVSTSTATVQVTDGEEPDNTLATASPLNPSTPPGDNGDLDIGYLTKAGDLNDWSVTVPQGDELAVALTNLPATYDLELFGPSSTGLQGAPSQDLGGVSDTLPSLSPGLTTEATPGSQDLAVMPPTGYQLEAVSNNPGSQSQYLQTPPLASGTYIVQVSGYNGAFSTQPYLLEANLLGGGPALSCPAAGTAADSGIVYPNALPTTTGPATVPTGYTTITPGGPNPAPGDLNTLFVVDTQRLGAAYGSDETTILSDIQKVDVDSAAGVVGAILPVDAYSAVQTAYATWNADPCSVAGANAVVAAIAAVIDQVRSTYPSVQNLVIVGADDQIPFARIADGATVSNERDYGASTFAGENNVEGDALSLGYYFSDDPYAATAPLGVGSATLYVPQLAVGRLVESASEIEGALTRFTGSGGDLDATSSLTTGYSFLSSGAEAVEANLANDRLSSTSACDLINASWAETDLANALAGADGCATPGVDSINAHFDYYAALPGVDDTDGTETNLITTTVVSDPSPSTSFGGRLLFSMGCHAGLDIDDAEVAASGIATPVADWAKTFADAGALWVANTGYGYADTDTIAYSAKLMAEFAGQLNGPLTIGEALTAAKQQYAAGNAILSPYDLKALMESTLYGLPMYHLNTSSTPAATLSQLAPSSGTTNTTGSASFTGQLKVSGATGTVTYSQSTGSSALSVSATGTVTTAASLAVGTYTATGTDSDTASDFGTWTYTLSVSPATETDATTGLSVAPVTLSLPVGGAAGDLGLVSNPNSNGSNPSGEYYEVNGATGGGTQTTEFRPIEPLASVPATEGGLVPHGALITGLTSEDFADVLPDYSLPAAGTDDSAPPDIGDAAFPGTLQRVATFGTFTSTGTSQAAQLDLVAGQFFPNPASTAGIGTERLFTSLSAQVYYDQSSGALASDYTPATIDSSQATTDPGTGFNFDVVTTPSSTTDPVKEVVVLYTDATSPGAWTTVLLSSTDGQNWTGTSTTTSSKIQYIVEAVDAAGNVSVSNNEGVDFNALQETTTSLTASATLATVGEPVSYTATIDPSGGVPTGSVEFLDGGTPISICGGTTGADVTASPAPAADSSTATCTVSYTSTGDHSITAEYTGDSNFAASLSNIESVTVSGTGTTSVSVSLSPSSSSVVYGDEQTLSFTSAVSSAGSSPSGTVVVAAGPTTLCSIVLPVTSCSVTGSTLLTASTTAYSVTASFNGGSADGGATSSAEPLTITQASSSPSVSVSPSPVSYGNEEAVVFTASVSPEYSGNPTGTISVSSGTTPLCAVVLPATSCSTTSQVVLAASAIPYAIAASYSGDGNFTASAANTANLTVNSDSTSASVSESPTSVVFGDESASQFTVVVKTGHGEALPEADPATVNVGSTSCAVSLAPAANGGTGSCKIANSALAASASAYAVTVSYAGDADLSASAQASAPTGLTVSSPSTSVALSLSKSTLTYGAEQAETFRATVTGTSSSLPTGTVSIKYGSTTLCSTTALTEKSASSVTATCSLTRAQEPVANYSVTAIYSGDAHNAGATSGPQTFAVTQDSTQTLVQELPTTVAYGSEQNLVFGVYVLTGQGESLPANEPLTVTVGTTTCSATMTPFLLGAIGACTIAAKALPVGAYKVSAAYPGDTDLKSSSGTASVGLTVVGAATTTGLSLSSSTVTYGNEATEVFSATVTSSAGTPTGTVAVASSAGALCQVTLSNGTGTCHPTATQLAAGTVSKVVATYAASGNFAGSSSPSALSFTVAKDASTTTVSESPASVAPGNESASVFTARVTTGHGEAVTNGETVKVTVGSTSCTVTLSAGTGTCKIANSALPAGRYAASATYPGDSNLTASSGASATNLTVT